MECPLAAHIPEPNPVLHAALRWCVKQLLRSKTWAPACLAAGCGPPSPSAATRQLKFWPRCLTSLARALSRSTAFLILEGWVPWRVCQFPLSHGSCKKATWSLQVDVLAGFACCLCRRIEYKHVPPQGSCKTTLWCTTKYSYIHSLLPLQG